MKTKPHRVPRVITFLKNTRRALDLDFGLFPAGQAQSSSVKVNQTKKAGGGAPIHLPGSILAVHLLICSMLTCGAAAKPLSPHQDKYDLARLLNPLTSSPPQTYSVPSLDQAEIKAF